MGQGAGKKLYDQSGLRFRTLGSFDLESVVADGAVLSAMNVALDQIRSNMPGSLSAAICDVAMHPTDDLLAALDSDGVCTMWQLSTQVQVMKQRGEEPVKQTCIAFQPDGLLLGYPRVTRLQRRHDALRKGQVAGGSCAL